MSMTLKEELARFFKESKYPVLFAGAGISAKAGLPTWGSYLTQLAKLIRSDDAMTATMMLDMIQRGDFLRAASYYFLSGEVREGDKLQNLITPLRNYQVEAIASLSALPFKAYVTTNFDQVLPDLYAHEKRKAPSCFDLGDPALAGAPFREDFFVARIHGKVQSPETMVLSQEHYATLPTRTGYVPILRHIFAYKQVLFVGFSFYDPAVQKVLDLVNAEMGPLTEGRHLAILPNNVSGDFINRLQRLNIRHVSYDPKDNHAELWEAIGFIAKNPTTPLATPTVSEIPEPMLVARRFLAACYARTQLRRGLVPLREVVLEGMIGQLVLTTNATGATKSEIKSELKRELHVSDRDADQIVDASLERLIKDGLCERHRDSSKTPRFYWVGPTGQNNLDDAIEILVTGTINRYVVRAQGHESSHIRKSLKEFYKTLVLRRGWDLGAAFASHRPPDATDIKRLMWSVSSTLSHPTIEGLIDATTNLINAPNIEEAEILTNLGRSSFALEIAIQSPGDTLLHKETLPQKIYLDANVLLPAITPGHPFHDIYDESISRLVEAAEKASIGIQLLVYVGFLNEVVSHRRIAIEAIQAMGERISEDLNRQVVLCGTEGMNVYLGAYATKYFDDKTLTFDQFLRNFVPYETEAQLAEFLNDKGIRIIGDIGLTGNDTIFGDLYHQLEISFADELASGRRKPILIRHDVSQLVALDEDIKRGVKSIFVTADRTLRDNVGNSRFARLANGMLSHVGLAQLIDLLLGPSDRQSMQAMARLIWSTRASSDFETARNYYIDLALEKYDEALAMTMGQVADKVAQAAVDAAKLQQITLHHTSEQDRLPATRVLERFEDEFFEEMRKIIETRRLQENRDPPK